MALSSCGSGGAVADARLSCRSVHASLALQKQSEQPGLTSAQRSRLQARAMSELLKATQPAANATSLDGSWNPLMTTINEAERVPLANLVPALTRLCRVADSSTPYL
ncbi:MAG: hypothetical protein ABSC34_12025 [Acidimicrobiales bacterium]